jgi:hypothetical protein
MVKRQRPPSQGWLTFLRNHASDIAAKSIYSLPAERQPDQVAQILADHRR